jgi:hypothetical protein
MKLRVVFDKDGTDELVIDGFRITTQLFKRGSGTALVNVYDETGKNTKCFHFAKVYYMEKNL